MERNNTIGLLLMAALLMGYMYFANKDRAKRMAEMEKKEEAARIKDSIARANDPKTEVLNDISEPTSPDTQSAQTTQTAEPDTTKTEEVPQIEEQLYTLENDKLKLTFSNKGGRIISAVLKEFTGFDDYNEGKDEQVEFISEYRSDFNYNIPVGNTNINTDVSFFDVNQSDKGLKFTYTAADGSEFKQSYALTSNPYLIDYKVDYNGNANELGLTWMNKFKRWEKFLRSEREFSYQAYKTGGKDGKIHKFKKFKADVSKSEEGKIGWILQRQRFFSQILFTEDILEDVNMKQSYDKKNDDYVKEHVTEATIRPNGKQLRMKMFIGPNERALLKDLDPQLDKTLPNGFFGFLTKWLAGLFGLLTPLSKNLGLLIVLMTIIVKLALSPLTYKSYLSQAKMAVLKPELEEIKEKFPKDQARQQQEQMKLYGKAGVSPLGGCLPSLLQIPIFFSLYYFFRTSMLFRQEKFLWANDMSTFDDLIKLPGNLPIGHISIFAVLYGIALFISMRANKNMTGMGGAPAGGNEMMQTQMKIMQYGMPIFLPLIFNSFPVALTFYYFCYNIINAIQSVVIKKFFIDEDKIHRQVQANKKKVKKKSGFQKRLEEAMKQQQAQRAKRKK